MIFTAILLLLLLLAIVEMFTGRSSKFAFGILFLFLTVLASFRYGLGTDYFSYRFLYEQALPIDDVNLFYAASQQEVGFQIIQGIFKFLDLDFQIMIFIFAVTTMLLFYRYIVDNSKLVITSLLILYSMYYFAYINSGIRQALTMALFASVLLPMLLERYYFRFVGFTLLFSLIHSSLLIVLVLPFTQIKQMRWNILIGIFLILGLWLITNESLFSVSEFLVSRYELYAETTTFSLLGLLSRIATLTMVVLLFFIVRQEANEKVGIVLKFYLTGFIIYLIFAQNDLIASRLHVYFKMFEITLVPNLFFLLKGHKKRFVFCILTISFLTIMWYKEISASLEQGGYPEQSQVYDYPYNSIFERKE